METVNSDIISADGHNDIRNDIRNDGGVETAVDYNIILVTAVDIRMHFI